VYLLPRLQQNRQKKPHLQLHKTLLIIASTFSSFLTKSAMKEFVLLPTFSEEF
jgi:hypothetical protein